MFQTRRHRSYEFLQLIFTSSISFHIITIDFVLVLSLFKLEEFNCLMSITCKYFKKMLLISKKTTHIVVQWSRFLFDKLNIVDWELFKTIISNRDRKFLFEMWNIMFKRFDARLLYFAAYHSQIDEQSERIN